MGKVECNAILFCEEAKRLESGAWDLSGVMRTIAPERLPTRLHHGFVFAELTGPAVTKEQVTLQLEWGGNRLPNELNVEFSAHGFAVLAARIKGIPLPGPGVLTFRLLHGGNPLAERKLVISGKRA